MSCTCEGKCDCHTKPYGGCACTRPGVSLEAAMSTDGEGFALDIETQAAQSRPTTPASIISHAPDYKDRSWEDYEFQELGMWVHLFAKRAQHRQNPEKLKKDLTDAQNYLYMMQAKLDALYPNVKRADRQPIPPGFRRT